ncbi:hypothetical protein LCGC14_2672570 [marine sediment metagenome]|uniref:PH domain-containing protein n=1 Tax=marine sediment metagenome TaxID=412755 RepID=A0A0F8ZNP3_9ZZZZ
MNNDLFKIRITDEDLDFTLSANTEYELEAKLMNWYNEITDFETNLDMIRERVGVKIEVLRADYDNEVIQ